MDPIEINCVVLTTYQLSPQQVGIFNLQAY